MIMMMMMITWRLLPSPFWAQGHVSSVLWCPIPIYVPSYQNQWKQVYRTEHEPKIQCTQAPGTSWVGPTLCDWPPWISVFSSIKWGWQHLPHGVLGKLMSSGLWKYLTQNMQKQIWLPFLSLVVFFMEQGHIFHKRHIAAVSVVVLIWFGLGFGLVGHFKVALMRKC